MPDINLGRITLCISAWYISSLCTLFMNKWYLLEESGLGGSPQTLALAQGVFSAATGAARHKRLPPKNEEGAEKEALPGSTPSEDTKSPLGRRAFLWEMFALGTMRLGTVVLGLVALQNLAVSFTETIKSSAPFVTAIFARMLLEERTPSRILISLIPIVIGLALSSCTETSFNAVGFAAAMMCNCVDCIQNVYSKRLLLRYTPLQLQFYASIAALGVQIPLMAAVQIYQSPFEAMARLSSSAAVMRVGPASATATVEAVRANATTVPSLSRYAVLYLSVNGLFFYIQSVSAYGLMDLVSPVTHSVCNCVKRVLLIWLSVLFWKNRVGPLNAAGTAVLFGGVLMYNHRIREQQQAHKNQEQQKAENVVLGNSEHNSAMSKSESHSSLPFLLRPDEEEATDCSSEEDKTSGSEKGGCSTIG